MTFSTKIGTKFYAFDTEKDLETAKKLYGRLPKGSDIEDTLEENCINWWYDEFDPEDF